MSDANPSISDCLWSPSGFAIAADDNGRCTCRPCHPDGTEFSRRLQWYAERRIKRVMRAAGHEFDDMEKWEWGL